MLNVYLTFLGFSKKPLLLLETVSIDGWKELLLPVEELGLCEPKDEPSSLFTLVCALDASEVFWSSPAILPL